MFVEHLLPLTSYFTCLSSVKKTEEQIKSTDYEDVTSCDMAPWRKSQQFHPKCCCLSTKLHGVNPRWQVHSWSKPWALLWSHVYSILYRCETWPVHFLRKNKVLRHCNKSHTFHFSLSHFCLTKMSTSLSFLILDYNIRHCAGYCCNCCIF